MIEFIADSEVRKKISETILMELSEWFGLPESTEEYIKSCGELPFWAASINGETAGFLAMKRTGPAAAEIYVMGVRKRYQRTGIGRALLQACEAYARENGYLYMQVKTVKRGCYDCYDRTNDFYRALGFQELECIPELWDSWNPCQIYIRYIGKEKSDGVRRKRMS